MKKISMICASALLSSFLFTSFAQTPANPGNGEASETNTCTPAPRKACCGPQNLSDTKIVGWAEDRTPFDGLNLSPDQQKKLEKLRDKKKDDRKKEKAERKKEKKERKDRRDDRRAEYDREIAKILTPEQYAAYKANCETIKTNKKIAGKRSGKKVHKDGRRHDKMHRSKQQNGIKGYGPGPRPVLMTNGRK